MYVCMCVRKIILIEIGKHMPLEKKGKITSIKAMLHQSTYVAFIKTKEPYGTLHVIAE